MTYTMTEQHQQRIGQSNKGKAISAETRQLLSEANKGKILTEPTKGKMRLASKTRRECSIDGQVFSSVKNASKELGIPTSTLRQRLNSANFTSYFYVEGVFEQVKNIVVEESVKEIESLTEEVGQVRRRLSKAEFLAAQAKARARKAEQKADNLEQQLVAVKKAGEQLIDNHAKEVNELEGRIVKIKKIAKNEIANANARIDFITEIQLKTAASVKARLDSEEWDKISDLFPSPRPLIQ